VPNFSETLGAGVTKTLPAGKYFFCSAAAQADLTVKFKKQGAYIASEQADAVGGGFKAQPPAPSGGGNAFDSVEVTSTAGGAFTFFITAGEVSIDSLEITNTVTVTELGVGTYTATASKTIGTSSAAVVSADATRKLLTVRSKAENSGDYFFHDTTAVVGTGVPLKPGESRQFAYTGALYAINDTASETLYVDEELT